MADRYRAAYKIDIASYSEKYVEDIETLNQLFDLDYIHPDFYQKVTFLPIIISCVDNNFSLQIFHQFFEKNNGPNKSWRIIIIAVGQDKWFVV